MRLSLTPPPDFLAFPLPLLLQLPPLLLDNSLIAALPRLALSPSRLPPRRLLLLLLHRSVFPMASTLAFLRPSASAPLAAGPARRATVASVRVPSRYRVLARVSLGLEVAVGADALFADYKPTTAFLFPGQGAQTVGMGVQAQSVLAAAKLFDKANAILGYDLLDLCTNGPKEKLDSTVISQL